MVVPSSIAVTTAPPYAGANRIRCERSTADPAALSALAWAPAGRGQRTPPRPPCHPRPRLPPPPPPPPPPAPPPPRRPPPPRDTSVFRRGGVPRRRPPPPGHHC